MELFSYSRGVSPSHWKVPSWAPSPDVDGLPVSFLHMDHFRTSGVNLGLKELGKVNDV